MTPDDIKDLLGEGFHTAFRKATDCDQAHPIWELIRDMPADDWRSVLEMVYDHVVVPAVQAEQEKLREAISKAAYHLEIATCRYADLATPERMKLLNELKAFAKNVLHSEKIT